MLSHTDRFQWRFPLMEISKYSQFEAPHTKWIAPLSNFKKFFLCRQLETIFLFWHVFVSVPFQCSLCITRKKKNKIHGANGQNVCKRVEKTLKNGRMTVWKMMWLNWILFHFFFSLLVQQWTKRIKKEWKHQQHTERVKNSAIRVIVWQLCVD